MSAGFKAMINIVAEIAYRCIELNGFLGENAVKQTPGIVMIDELDLYLHPHWQQHVLADLQEAFPKFQFIVTTHSPFIVQSVDINNIIVLDTSYIGSESPSNRGIEEIAAAAMGMEGMLRSEKYRKKQELADKYYKLVKEGKAGQKEIEIVRDELNELEQEADLLNDPAYSSFLKLNRGNL
jgi:predicted ATP-binding protein involved in virulence